MRMLRHYFISDNLDDLELFEEQMEAAGIPTPQIHVLSQHDAEIDHHEHLHRVHSFMKKDIIHSSELGALVGLGAAAFVLVLAHFAGWTHSPAGWMPFIFLAFLMFGFCIWEGGLLGIQKPNYHFARFAEALKADKHIFFVDLEPSQEGVLEKVFKDHPHVELAGTGSSTPHWLVELQNKLPRFFKQTFP